MYSDYYENNADLFHQWISNEIYNNGDSIIDPYQQNWDHPVAYLMYYLNQITDHYASGRTNGDDFYDSNCPGLSNVIPDLLSPITTAGVNETNCSQMHDVLQPLAIRATAGLLYWFAVETGLLPTIPIESASLLGDLTLYAEMTGHWYVEREYGIPPITYNWEIMYTDGGGYLESYELVKNEKNKRDKDKKNENKDDPWIEAAPSEEWVPVGTNSAFFEKPHNPYDLRDFYLRCTVTDGSSTTKTSNVFYVDVVSYPPPQANIVQADNPETTPIAKSFNAMTQNSDAAMAEENLPDNFVLEQNYPNPFNPTTNLTYTIPEGGFVTLKVYDMLGREAATLVNANKPAGRYTVEFNAHNLPSGTYVYKLISGNYFVVKKMSLVK